VSIRSSDTDGPLWHTTASTTLGGTGFLEGTSSSMDKLERCSQEGSTKNRTHLGRGSGIGLQ